jgi:4-amino-4-deoxy-L-arabinose transferase-like glycosyltransferase
MLFWLLVAGALLVAFYGKVRRTQLARRQGTDGAAAAVEGTAPPEVRSIIAVLLAGGLSLVLLGFITLDARATGPPLLLYLLIALGLVAFLLAGRIAVYGPLPDSLNVVWQRAAGWFGVQRAQLLLLLLALPLALLAYLAGGDRLLAWHPAAAVISWCLALAAMLVGGYHHDDRVAVPPWEIGLAILLAAGAFLLRGIGLEGLPTTLSGDEASAGLEAVRFARGEANNLFGLGWFSFPAFYFAFQGASISLFGQTATALRLTSALGGALTVFAVYWLARSLFGRVAALIAASFLLASHYHIHFSRIGLQNIWDGFFLAVVLWGIWAGWKEGRRLPFLMGGLALGLGHYFYVSTRVVPLLLLLWAGIAMLLRRSRFRARLPGLVVAAYAALIAYLPLGLLFLRQTDEFFAPMRRVSVFNGWLESEMARLGQPAWEIIATQMKATALGFTHLPLRHWYNPGEPILLPLAAALFIAGLAWLVYSADLRSLLLLLVLSALVLLGGFSLDAPASQRYAIAMPVVAILVSLPLAQGLAWLAPYGRQGKWLAGVVVFLLVALVALRDVQYYFAEVYNSYVLGGYNTETATAIARYLENEPPRDVYFFGLPRMGYSSLSTIPYLAPQMEGIDVNAPLVEAARWVLQEPALFIFLPERQDELEYVRMTYPEGRYFEAAAAAGGSGGPLFSVYEVIPAESAHYPPP